jgi:hypothetical protein
MIISHKHKFIFIRTKKTASTSIEIALSEFLGDSDIITTIAKADEKTRSQLGYTGPQNYLIPFSSYKTKDWRRLVIKGKRIQYTNHMDARSIRKLVGKKIWNNYYKFCFERNPWDKVISYYYWRHKTEPRPTISEFIHSGRAHILSASGGFDAYSIKGEIAVDRVCAYENLEEEMQHLAERIGLPGIPRLPNAKGGHRKDRRPYRDSLSDQDRIDISRIFAREIAYFGYTF